MKRSELIKKLQAMPGDDPKVIFTRDNEEIDLLHIVPDFDVTTDCEGNPVQVPTYIDIQVS